MAWGAASHDPTVLDSFLGAVGYYILFYHVFKAIKSLFTQQKVVVSGSSVENSRIEAMRHQEELEQGLHADYWTADSSHFRDSKGPLRESFCERELLVRER